MFFLCGYRPIFHKNRASLAIGFRCLSFEVKTVSSISRDPRIRFARQLAGQDRLDRGYQLVSRSDIDTRRDQELLGEDARKRYVFGYQIYVVIGDMRYRQTFSGLYIYFGLLTIV